jgi:hypothetical protein
MIHQTHSPVHVAGRFGYLQVTPTVLERNAGFREAYMVVDFSRIAEDGGPEFVYADAVCTRAAAIGHARELHRYEVEGGEALNRRAIAEWAAELAR